jgi:L-lactate dehydrogenase complex protein LldE
MRLLQKVRQIELVPLEAVEQCCGFGGTFAIKNADVSGAMLEEKLHCLKQTQAEICTACDNSCLMHIGGALHRQRAGMRTQHIAQILASDGNPSQRNDGL